MTRKFCKNSLQDNLKRINEVGGVAGWKIEIQKTMTMVFGQEKEYHKGIDDQ